MLKSGTLLQGRFRVDKTLYENDQYIMYSGFDGSSRVFITEYCPMNIAFGWDSDQNLVVAEVDQPRFYEEMAKLEEGFMKIKKSEINKNFRFRECFRDKGNFFAISDFFEADQKGASNMSANEMRTVWGDFFRSIDKCSEDSLFFELNADSVNIVDGNIRIQAFKRNDFDENASGENLAEFVTEVFSKSETTEGRAILKAVEDVAAEKSGLNLSSIVAALTFTLTKTITIRGKYFYFTVIAAACIVLFFSSLLFLAAKPYVDSVINATEAIEIPVSTSSSPKEIFVDF